MSPDPAPAELPFGAAYERLQAVAAELGSDATMAPDRLIALLREGKGLERALREHLERVEQEVRAIEDGEGTTPYRIVEAAPAAPSPAVAPSPVAASSPAAPPPAVPRPAAPSSPGPPSAAPPSPGTAPDAAPQPSLGFADDDIPF